MSGLKLLSIFKLSSAAIGALGLGVCLVILILDMNKLNGFQTIGIIIGGFGLVGWTVYVVMARDEKRRYQTLIKTNNKRLKTLCLDQNLNDELKVIIRETLKANLEAEKNLIFGGWTDFNEIKSLIEAQQSHIDNKIEQQSTSIRELQNEIEQQSTSINNLQDSIDQLPKNSQQNNP